MKKIIYLGLCSTLLLSCISEKDKKARSKQKVRDSGVGETPGPRKPPEIGRRPPSPSEYPPEIEVPRCETYCSNWKVDNDLSYNTMAFPNFGHLGIGRCRGHAIVTQKLSQLMIFKPSETCTEDEDTCNITIIEKLRAALIDYEVVEIPGYENLLELSTNFIYQRYLKGWVRGTPANFNARRSDVAYDEYTDPQKNLYFDIIQKIESGMVPYLGILGTQKISSHALLAMRVARNENGNIICVEDSNIVADISDNNLCENYIYYDDLNQSLYYQKGDWTERLNYMSTYMDDEERHQRYQAAWNQYCLDNFKGVVCN